MQVGNFQRKMILGIFRAADVNNRNARIVLIQALHIFSGVICAASFTSKKRRYAAVGEILCRRIHRLDRTLQHNAAQFSAVRDVSFEIVLFRHIGGNMGGNSTA